MDQGVLPAACDADEVAVVRNREANARLREMNRLLEAEAARIARALHDQAATLLATVSIRTSRGMLQCRVHDDGRGFDVSAYRENGANSRGLGLLCMEERICALDGRIRIESSPGRGTRIDICVPTQATARA